MNLPDWLPRDKVLRAAMGAATVVGVLAVLAIAKHDIGFALAVATTLVRGEGEVSVLDAAATAAPGFLAWGVPASFSLR